MAGDKREEDDKNLSDAVERTFEESDLYNSRLASRPAREAEALDVC